MKDVIKKILKEEEDFDWIKDQQPVPKEKIIDKFGKFMKYPKPEPLTEVTLHLLVPTMVVESGKNLILNNNMLNNYTIKDLFKIINKKIEKR